MRKNNNTERKKMKSGTKNLNTYRENSMLGRKRN